MGYADWRIDHPVSAQCSSVVDLQDSHYPTLPLHICRRTQWRVHVPGAREYRIFSLTSIESEKPMPEDGRFPLGSIINSFMFGANRNE